MRGAAAGAAAAAAARPAPAAAACLACGATGGALLTCTGCASAQFCNADCQRSAWRAHKPACLAARPQALDWSVTDIRNAPPGVPARMSMRLFFSHHAVFRTLDAANAFLDHVVRLVGVPPGDHARPLPLCGAAYKRAVLANMGSPLVHHTYCVSLDLLAYSFVFETLGGLARVWLCNMGSFSVGEWAAPTPQARWPPALVAAHARWGGGRDLSRAELEAFLDVLLELRAAAEACGEELVATFPLAAVRQADARFYALPTHTPADGQPPLFTWLMEHIVGARNYPSNVSVFYPLGEQEPLVLLTNGAHEGPELQLSLSPPRAQRLLAAQLALNGGLPTPEALLKTLIWARYRRRGTYHSQPAWSHTPLVQFKGGLEARAAQPATFPVGEAGVEEWGTQRALVPVAALAPPSPAALAAAFPAVRAAALAAMGAPASAVRASMGMR